MTCPDCEHTTIATWTSHDEHQITTRPCPRHTPDPTPLDQARAEIEAIDRAAQQPEAT